MTTFPEPEIIDVNGVSLEVYSAGDGEPLILCHGWPELAFSWRHQVAPLVEAGYRVIMPNQRGYGRSSRPEAVEDYDIHHLCGDLDALLNRYGYADARFVGHDWGAIVVWNMAMLYPRRVRGVINLSVPFMERGPTEWVSFWESRLGPDFYIVHFNRQPGVADAVFAENTRNFLRNLYRTGQWLEEPADLGPGMRLINLARAEHVPGKPVMSDAELDVFVASFKNSGFTGGINWYRNFTRNWETTRDVPQQVEQPVLMIHGKYDIVAANPRLANYAPSSEVHTLPCGHWIQQEQPAETNRLILNWLSRH